MLAGSVTVTGCDAHLTHGMLTDLAQLGLSLLPPKGLLKKHRPPELPPPNPTGSQLSNVAFTDGKAKPKLAVQVTKLNVAITNVVVGYQTAVQVAAADCLQEQDSALTLSVTQCVTLQELVAEAYPLTYTGAVQMSNLTVSYQEANGNAGHEASQAGQPRHLHHEVDILRAGQLTVQVSPATEDAAAASAKHSGLPQGNMSSSGGCSLSQEDQKPSNRQAPSLAATVAMAAWYTAFHADAVVGACKAASDLVSVARQAADSLTTVNSESVDINSKPATIPVVNSGQGQVAPAAAASHAADGPASVIRTKLSKLQKLPCVQLTVKLDTWQTNIFIADHILWGVRVADAQLKLDSRTVVAVQQHHLQTQLSQLIHASEDSGQAAQWSEPASSAEVTETQQPDKQSAQLQPQQPDRRQQHDPQSHDPQQEPEQDPEQMQTSKDAVESSQRPSMVARMIALTLNKKALLQCGEIEASLILNPMPEAQRMARALGSTASLGSLKRQASLGKSKSWLYSRCGALDACPVASTAPATSF